MEKIIFTSSKRLPRLNVTPSEPKLDSQFIIDAFGAQSVYKIETNDLLTIREAMTQLLDKK